MALIQYSILVVRSGYTKSSGIKDSMSVVMKSFICRGCLNPVTSRPAGCTSVDIGASANLELVDKFCGS